MKYTTFEKNIKNKLLGARKTGFNDLFKHIMLIRTNDQRKLKLSLRAICSEISMSFSVAPMRTITGAVRVEFVPLEYAQ